MANREIRARIERNGLRHWQVADAIGISAASLVRWLRSPLTEERLQRVQAAIDKLLAERKGGDNE